MKQFLKSKSEITNWLEKHHVSEYVLIPDESYGFIVNCFNTVNLEKNKLNFIPVKFNTCWKDFYCFDNQLQDLSFAPHLVLGCFHCDSNKLSSLINCPQSIGGDFYFSNNPINSVEYFPNKVKGEISAFNTNLGKLSSSHSFNDFHEEYLRIKKIKDLKNKLEHQSDLNQIIDPKKTKI